MKLKIEHHGRLENVFHFVFFLFFFILLRSSQPVTIPDQLSFLVVVVAALTGGVTK